MTHGGIAVMFPQIAHQATRAHRRPTETGTADSLGGRTAALRGGPEVPTDAVQS